ncbi:MAG TPA: hypothetical protein VJQ57_13780 [Acidimicrobiia bacterium]|nr:hypothetical protein [Acidimicrobiia bacterium]
MIRLCGMFHCPPSQLDQEDASIIRLMNIVARGTKEADGASE